VPLLKLPILLGNLALHKAMKRRTKRQRVAAGSATPERTHTNPV